MMRDACIEDTPLLPIVCTSHSCRVEDPTRGEQNHGEHTRARTVFIISKVKKMHYKAGEV